MQVCLRLLAQIWCSAGTDADTDSLAGIRLKRSTSSWQSCPQASHASCSGLRPWSVLHSADTGQVGGALHLQCTPATIRY